MYGVFKDLLKCLLLELGLDNRIGEKIIEILIGFYNILYLSAIFFYFAQHVLFYRRVEQRFRISMCNSYISHRNRTQRPANLHEAGESARLLSAKMIWMLNCSMTIMVRQEKYHSYRNSLMSIYYVRNF